MAWLIFDASLSTQMIRIDKRGLYQRNIERQRDLLSKFCFRNFGRSKTQHGFLVRKCSSLGGLQTCDSICTFQFSKISHVASVDLDSDDFSLSTHTVKCHLVRNGNASLPALGLFTCLLLINTYLDSIPHTKFCLVPRK
jgi:hypothetical protein